MPENNPTGVASSTSSVLQQQHQQEPVLLLQGQIEHHPNTSPGPSPPSPKDKMAGQEQAATSTTTLPSPSSRRAGSRGGSGSGNIRSAITSTTPRVVAIVQARMNSSRLPNKVLLPLAEVSPGSCTTGSKNSKATTGKNRLSVIGCVVKRLEMCAEITDIIVATSTKTADDALYDHVTKELGAKCYRGSEKNVLDRFFQAANMIEPDLVLRLTGDCPLLDPDILDDMVRFFKQERADLFYHRSAQLPRRSSGLISCLKPPSRTSTAAGPPLSGQGDNNLSQGEKRSVPLEYLSPLRFGGVTSAFPDGFDVEVFTFEALKNAYHSASDLYDLEHVTPFLRRQKEKCATFRYPVPKNYPEKLLENMHVSLDSQEDLVFIRDTVLKEVGKPFEDVRLRDVLELMLKKAGGSGSGAEVEVVGGGGGEKGGVGGESGEVKEENGAKVDFSSGSKADEYGVAPGQVGSNSKSNLNSTAAAATNKNGLGQLLYVEAKKMIPGGTQLLSKRPEMFLPDQWPAYYQHASGIEVSTLDGIRLQDFSLMGVGACILGYADEDVNREVHKAVDRGNMCTLNCPSEVELTKLLLELHPWAGMCRYTRNAGDACTVAVRIGRAFSQRDKVAFCGYHGWADWYLAANWNDGGDANLGAHLLQGLSPNGVPKALRNTSFPFKYNDFAELEKIYAAQNGEIGVVIMEPQRSVPPADNFLQKVRNFCTAKGIVLIFDEISSGFRLNCGGLHLTYGVEPDLATFGKAMSNGYPIGAVVGKTSVMATAQDTFISSTYYTEDIGFVASVATIKKLRDKDVGNHIKRIGDYFQTGIKQAADESGVQIAVSGLPCFSAFGFEYPDMAAELKTLYVQKMLEKGYLAKTGLYPSYAHKEADVDAYLLVAKQVFTELKKLMDQGGKDELLSALNGPVAHAGFQRLA